MLDYNFGDALPVHEHGYVKLLEIMGCDETIVDAARISYDRRGRTADRALIRYLLRHRHTSPFEMAEMKFELKMPIFVARQWVRHRTANMNEVSARYTELPDEMFVPEVFAIQATNNKQGRGDDIDERQQNELHVTVDCANRDSYVEYQKLLKQGVSRELARGVLPLNIYTKFVWKIDLHNLMHFLKLRLDPHAQQEIRDYAEILENLVALHFPLTYEAFVDYVRDAYTLSRMEVAVIKEIMYAYADFHIDRITETSDMSEREIKEFNKRFLGHGD